MRYGNEIYMDKIYICETYYVPCLIGRLIFTWVNDMGWKKISEKRVIVVFKGLYNLVCSKALNFLFLQRENSGSRTQWVVSWTEQRAHKSEKNEKECRIKVFFFPHISQNPWSS